MYENKNQLVFRFVGVIAFLTTAVACILYFSQIVIDGITLKTVVPHRAHDFHDFFLAFGTLLFAFGGASTFPTIQNDMQEKDKFSISVIIAFSGKFVNRLYFLVLMHFL